MPRPTLALVAAGLLLAACGGDADAPADGSTPLSVWFHTGKPAEAAAIEAQVASFEAANPGIDVELTMIPEASYNEQVQAAAVAGKLPDVLDLDGPYLASYAWQGRLMPLDGLLTSQLQADLLPSIQAQGRWNDRLWGVGTFDSGLGLYVNTALLPAGTELPATPEDAWSAAEFTLLLEQLAIHRATAATAEGIRRAPVPCSPHRAPPRSASAGSGDRAGARTGAGGARAPAGSRSPA